MELIGITTYYVPKALKRSSPRGLPDQDLLISTMDYSRMVLPWGGSPVTIPVLHDEEYIEELVRRCSGFIFSGGSDIHPFQYREPVREGLGLYVPERDEFELKLLERVVHAKKPIFGICRGLHLINTFFGGTLYQDIKESDLTSIEHLASMGPKYGLIHRVNITQKSKLYSIFKKKEIWVNSLHHQAVERLGEGLYTTATGEDGIIEALEHKEYPTLLAVQWHPEMMGEVYREQGELFKAFLTMCKEGSK